MLLHCPKQYEGEIWPFPMFHIQMLKMEMPGAIPNSFPASAEVSR
jgi:hypothetical protein